MTVYLQKVLAAQKNGKTAGITSVCSANPFVLRAAMENARARGQHLCIESTGRQVNQDGGYAGMTPKEFARTVQLISTETRADPEKIILGGDHLGPGAWRRENSETAMAKASELVCQCVLAGYQKIHLDPSMPCRDDVKDGLSELSLETIAERTALLCQAAEKAAADRPGQQLVYIVGAEVPVPGGMPAGKNGVSVTSPDNVEKTIHCIRQAFVSKGLEDAWDRCIALVAESGASFGPEVIYDYDSTKTRPLTSFIEKEERLIFEAHSTDFQTRQALCHMIRDHFAILKVGPCLTYAVRETLFALAHIEREWLAGRKGVHLSRLPEHMMALMEKDKRIWRDHYKGSDAYQRYITAFGFSDRIRYYWTLPEAKAAVSRLFENLSRYGIPLPLLSQYLPEQFEAIREGRLDPEPALLVYDKVIKILNRYADACGEGIEG